MSDRRRDTRRVRPPAATSRLAVAVCADLAGDEREGKTPWTRATPCRDSGGDLENASNEGGAAAGEGAATCAGIKQKHLRRRETLRRGRPRCSEHSKK